MKIVKNFNELIKALGIKPGDKIEFTGSQHHRDYELEIDFIPSNKEELETIIFSASQKDLIKMGVAIWTSYDSEEKATRTPLNKRYLKPGEVHYLFPQEWYDYIPNGFKIVNIFGENKTFIHGQTDDDMRFGCLAFGFVRLEK